MAASFRRDRALEAPKLRISIVGVILVSSVSRCLQVAEARKRKARRLKQAKDEAQSEIEKYRHEKETSFKVSLIRSGRD